MLHDFPLSSSGIIFEPAGEGFREGAVVSDLVPDGFGLISHDKHPAGTVAFLPPNRPQGDFLPMLKKYYFWCRSHASENQSTLIPGAAKRRPAYIQARTRAPMGRPIDQNYDISMKQTTGQRPHELSR